MIPFLIYFQPGVIFPLVVLDKIHNSKIQKLAQEFQNSENAPNTMMPKDSS